MSILLKVENLSRSFGGIHANSDISFDVKEGEILGVIGPNGAGKSTLFDLITGFTKSDKGQVLLREKNITNIRPDLICRMGVGRTFQKLKPFADQTLLENSDIGIKITAPIIGPQIFPTPPITEINKTKIEINTTRSPMRLDGRTLNNRKGAPRLGEDTERIRKEFLGGK